MASQKKAAKDQHVHDEGACCECGREHCCCDCPSFGGPIYAPVLAMVLPRTPRGEAECPNCSAPLLDEPRYACVLEAMLSVIIDRGGHTAKRVMAFLADVDEDKFWDEVGPVIDNLESDLDEHVERMQATDEDKPELTGDEICSQCGKRAADWANANDLCGACGAEVSTWVTAKGDAS